MAIHSTRTTYPTLVTVSMSLFAMSVALSKTASNIFIGAIVLSTFAALLLNRQFRESLRHNIRQPLLLPLGIVLGIAVIGLLFTTDMFHGFGIVNKIIGLLLVYLMVSSLLDSLDEVRGDYRNTNLILFAFLVGIVVLDFIGFSTYLGFIADRKYSLPLYPLHIHHIWFSNLNAIGLYITVAFVFFSRERLSVGRRSFLAIFVITACTAILLSMSRTAWNGMFVTVIVLAVVFLKNKKHIFLIVSGLFTSLILLYLFNDIVHSRLNLILSDIASYKQGNAWTNVGARFMLWKASIRMFLTNPITGVGTGDFVFTLNSYIVSGDSPWFLQYFNQPHNMFLFTLATNGLPGLAALLFMFYYCLRTGIRFSTADGRKKMFAFLTVATVVHFMIGGMTDSFLNIQMLRYTFGFMMGMCFRRSVFSRT